MYFRQAVSSTLTKRVKNNIQNKQLHCYIGRKDKYEVRGYMIRHSGRIFFKETVCREK